MTGCGTSQSLDRERVVSDHMPQVELIAKSIHRRCPPCVLLNDLVSVGTLGLLQAVARFDPDRNLKLKTLPEHRIRGAILDYLRQLDPLTRSVRQFERRRATAALHLEARLGRSPSEDEVAETLGVPLARYRRLVLAGEAGSTNYFDAFRNSRQLPSRVAVEVERIEESERICRLRVAIGDLPARESQVIAALSRGRASREVAGQLGISMSSVALLKKRAIQQLRLFLTGVPTPTR